MKLVSAIMPTRGRSEFARQAIQCFLSQNYRNKELIILDDEEDSSFASFPQGCTSYAISTLRSIALKRNLCCEMASGDVIMHFDDDDWSAPERMADQVERLESSGLSVTAYYTMPFYDVETDKWHLYQSNPSFGAGTSLAYTREWWRVHPFVDYPTIRTMYSVRPRKCEDNDMIEKARHAHQLITAPCEKMMVARNHAGSTIQRHMRDMRTLPEEMIPPGFLAYARG